MKKKILILVLCISAVCAATGAVHIMCNKNPFDKLSASNIQQIDLSNSVQVVTTENENDIKLILHTLKSMKVKRITSRKKDGFAAMVNMKLNSGKQMDVVIRSGDMVLNNTSYKPDKDYSDEFQSILEQIMESQIIPE